jgi:hypothetical protein
VSAADLYGGCPGCGVNVDPAEHDCPEAERAAIARAVRLGALLDDAGRAVIAEVSS